MDTKIKRLLENLDKVTSNTHIKLNEYDDATTMAEFNESLEETANELKNVIDNLIHRYKYRTMENISYSKEEARKMAIEIDEKLKEVQDTISNLWNLIG